MRIEFPDGVIGIIGNNGAGKSSLMEAIAWALYGNKHDIVRTKKEDVIRTGALPSEKCYVELGFEFAGNEYVLKREMKNRTYTMDAVIYKNGICDARSSEKVTEYVENLLGADYKAFRISIYAQQNELNALLAFEVPKRKEIIMKMLGVDDVQKAIDKVREDKRALREQIKGLEATVLSDSEEARYKNVVESGIRSLKNLEEKIAAIDRELATARGELARVSERLEQLRKLRHRHSELISEKNRVEVELGGMTSRKRRLVEELQEIERARQRMKELASVEEKYKRLLEQKNALEIQREKQRAKLQVMSELEERTRKQSLLCEEINKLDEKLQDLVYIEGRLNEIKEKIERTEAEMDKNKSKLEKLRRDKAALTSKIEEVKSQIREMEALGPESSCPLCRRELGSHYSVLLGMLSLELKSLQQKLASIEDAEYELAGVVKALETQHKDALRQHENLRARSADLKAIEARRAVLFSQRADVERQVLRLKAEAEKYQTVKFDEKEYESVCKLVRELEPQHEEFVSCTRFVTREGEIKAEIKTLEQKIGSYTSMLKEIEDRIEKLGFSEDAYAAVEKEHSNAKDRLHALEMEMRKLSNDQALLIKEIENAKKTLERNDRIKAEISEKRHEVMYLEKLAADKDRDGGLLISFKQYIISRIRPLLMDYTSAVLSSLTGGLFSDVEIDEDYNIKICDNGVYYPLARFSGGQKDRANLSLRIAISKIIAERHGNTFNMIILDEVFGSQDTEGRRNIIDVLEGLSKQFRQIFIITHIEDLKEFMPVLVEVYVDENGISHAVLRGG